MLKLFNNNTVVKELFRSNIAPSITHCCGDYPPLSWRDVFERPAISLELFAILLGPKMLDEVRYSAQILLHVTDCL